MPEKKTAPGCEFMFVHQEIVDQVNQALSQLLQDGTVEQIFQEYDTVYVSPLS